MSLGLKKNDTVLVIAGKEKGKKGRVLVVDRRRDRVTVEKVNIVKKHMKPNRVYTQGGIIEKEAPLHRSNVMLVCPKCNAATRIRTESFDGVRMRVCKKCKEVIDR